MHDRVHSDSESSGDIVEEVVHKECVTESSDLRAQEE
jgi:hypothetical protein